MHAKADRSLINQSALKHAAHHGSCKIQVKALEAARYAQEQEEAHREALEERTRKKQAHQQ